MKIIIWGGSDVFFFFFSVFFESNALAFKSRNLFPVYVEYSISSDDKIQNAFEWIFFSSSSANANARHNELTRTVEKNRKRRHNVSSNIPTANFLRCVSARLQANIIDITYVFVPFICQMSRLSPCSLFNINIQIQFKMNVARMPETRKMLQTSIVLTATNTANSRVNNILRMRVETREK